MSRIISASIGSYLLQGWTLTDDGCPVCHTPRMRRPQSTELLCVSCNSTNTSAGASSTASTVSTTTGQDTDAGVLTPLTDPHSRSSTPDFPFVESPAMIARREATDRASSEIGRRLLQGWTMLAEACPNPSCYASPLMRKPATARATPSQMDCVVCGRTYLSERDVAAQAAQATAATPSEPVSQEPTLPISVPLAPVPEVPKPKTTTDSSPLKSISLTGTTSSGLSSAADSLEDAVQNMSRRLAQLTSAANVDLRVITETTAALSGLLDVVIKMRTLPSR